MEDILTKEQKDFGWVVTANGFMIELPRYRISAWIERGDYEIIESHVRWLDGKIVKANRFENFHQAIIATTELVRAFEILCGWHIAIFVTGKASIVASLTEEQ